jgi:hypothetical protein
VRDLDHVTAAELTTRHLIELRVSTATSLGADR